MRYIGGDKKMIIVDASANFEGLVEKICYRLRINQRRSNAHIYMENDFVVFENPYELQDDEEVEFVMIIVGKKVLTHLYVAETLIEEKDNLDEE